MSDFPIIEKLGGRDQVRDALAARGLKKTKDAIRMWTARGSIPGKAVVALQAIALERGVGLDLSDYALRVETSEAA